MMSVTALAIGYLVMNVFGTRSNVSGDVCSTLFGSTSILTLTSFDVGVCAVMSVTVIGGFALLYNRVFAVTFDEVFARASGLPVGRYNLAIAVMIAFVIVVGMNLVGALLLSALVVFPALSAIPGEYPDDTAEVVVTGKFEPYREGSVNYVHLVDASLQAA